MMSIQPFSAVLAKKRSCASVSPENTREMLKKVRELKTERDVFHACVFKHTTETAGVSSGLRPIHRILKQGHPRLGVGCIIRFGDKCVYIYSQLRVKGSIVFKVVHYCLVISNSYYQYGGETVKPCLQLPHSPPKANLGRVTHQRLSVCC